MRIPRRNLFPGQGPLQTELTRRDEQIADAINSLVDDVAALGSPSGISDGDKGDITVSSSGSVWTLDSATVGVAKLSASGAASVSTYLRGDNQWATPAAVVDDGSITRAKLSASGTPDTSVFLRGDYQWVTPTAIVADGSITATKLSASASAGVNTFLRGDFQWVSRYHVVATLANDISVGAVTGAITATDLTGLAWTYEANSIYFFRWQGGIRNAAAGTGAAFMLDVNSVVTEISMQFFHQLATTGTLTGGSSKADNTVYGRSSGVPGAVYVPVFGHGMLRTGANTGTAQMRFQSEISATAVCSAGTTLVVEKVA